VASKIEFDAVTEAIRIIREDLGFEDVDSLNVRECLYLHSQPLTGAELTDLEQQRTYKEKQQFAPEGEESVSKEIMIKELEKMFRNLETVEQQIMDLYPPVWKEACN
jgi:hypothetical protein